MPLNVQEPCRSRGSSAGSSAAMRRGTVRRRSSGCCPCCGRRDEGRSTGSTAATRELFGHVMGKSWQNPGEKSRNIRYINGGLQNHRSKWWDFYGFVIAMALLKVIFEVVPMGHRDSTWGIHRGGELLWPTTVLIFWCWCVYSIVTMIVLMKMLVMYKYVYYIYGNDI